MPKYRVFIAEMEIFDFDVAANDEATAETEAMTLLASTSRNAIYHHVSSFAVMPLSDDAEVENEQ